MATRRRRSAEPVRGAIAVAGATGFTGGLVLDNLVAAGAEMVAIGRNPERLQQLKQRHGALRTAACPGWSVEELRRSMDGCVAVISCAGPFVRAGAPVVEAAVSAGLSYCDSTGELDFIRWVYDNLDSRAREAGVALVPAFGFDYVPGDLGIALAAQGLGALRSAEAIYNAGTSSASRGTRQSMVGVLASGEFGRRVRQVDGRTVVSFPGGELAMVPRHLDVQEVTAYMLLPAPVRAVKVAQRLLGFAPARAAVSRLSSLGPGEVPTSARSRRWWCEAHVEATSGERVRLRLTGSDVYGFTAKALVGLALRMAAGRVDATGARAPAEVVEAQEFLDELQVAVAAAN